MILFYIRHGDPIYNPDSLTPLGHRQAEAVAKRLAVYGIDRIFVSSSNRAMLTAKPTEELTKKQATVLDWCNESHAWKQLTVPIPGTNKVTWAFSDEATQLLFRSPEIRDMGENWIHHPAFENTRFGEGIRRIQTEADAFLESLGYRHNKEKAYYEVLEKSDERIALFAHQGFGLAFLSCVLDVPYPMFSTRFDLTHSSMTVIEFNEKDGISSPKCLELANDSHIYREGLPTKYNNRLYI